MPSSVARLYAVKDVDPGRRLEDNSAEFGSITDKVDIHLIPEYSVR